MLYSKNILISQLKKIFIYSYINNYIKLIFFLMARILLNRGFKVTRILGWIGYKTSHKKNNYCSKFKII